MASQTLQYLKYDFQSQKDALLQRVRARWPGRWNDFLSNSLGIVIIDIVAWGLTTLAFLINRVAGEQYVSTMTLRESAIRIGALTGYQLSSARPATVSCEAYLTTAQSSPVTLAAGTLIRTSDSTNQPFEVVSDYVIAAGALTPSRLVATFSPAQSGQNIINTLLQVTNGSSIVYEVDTTIDLSQYIEPGQVMCALNTPTETYSIVSLESAPGAVQVNSGMVLATPWTGATGTIEAQILDLRIQLVQGQTVTDQFVAPAQTAGYSVMLSQTPVIDNAVTVTVNGELWAAAPSVGIQSSTATVFQIKTYVSGNTAIIFGDGTFGQQIPANAAITVTYRIGGGLAGNIALNTINTTVTGLILSLSNPVPVQITNSTGTGVGGQDAETLEEARINIPYYARTNDRAVTLSDYQTIAQQYSDPQFGSVAYARAVVRTENALLEGNVVSVYAWTTGPGGGLVNLGAQLKTEVQAYLQTKSVGTDFVQMLDGTSVPVPLSLRFQAASGASVSDTETNVLNVINSYVTALFPGDPVVYSDLLTQMAAAPGVGSLNMATPVNDLYPANSMQLFSVPQDTFVYSLNAISTGSPQLDANGASVSAYNVQLPIFPLQTWSLNLYLGTNKVSILPYISAGIDGNVLVQQARLMGTGLSADDAYTSVVNLLTGQATVWLIGAPGDLSMELVTVQGYSSVRTVNLYVGYTGDNSQTVRQQVRTALQAWGQGLFIGGSIYAARAEGISASVVSVTDMVSVIPGVAAVTQVALDTPANTLNVVTASDIELLRLGQIIINNQIS